MDKKAPRVFISYSWTLQERVKEWAERLLSDGVDVILDLYDLKEGHDKYVFMEKMASDPTITHVLVFCDREYSERADSRRAGVGTESQIISKEVYDKAEQSRYIPIACDSDENGTPILPIFLRARIWIDFSSPEAANENWEQLIRLLFDKPLHEKPKVGKPPAYVSEDSATPSNPASAKYSTLKQAIIQGKNTVPYHRSDFLDACISYADSLRIREQPDEGNLGERVLSDCNRLKPIRNLIVDWVLLETQIPQPGNFTDELISFLERFRELKSRPKEIVSWDNKWFEAQSFFVYETFIYIIAALLKTKSFQTLNEIFSAHYLIPETECYTNDRYERFGCFHGYAGTIQPLLSPPDRRLISPTAFLIKRQADRRDLSFESLIQAELLILLMMYITPDEHWYPGTLHYARNIRTFPLFVQAIQKRGFKNLATITGISSAEELRTAVKEGIKRTEITKWDFDFRDGFWKAMNLDQLDTL